MPFTPDGVDFSKINVKKTKSLAVLTKGVNIVVGPFIHRKGPKKGPFLPVSQWVSTAEVRHGTSKLKKHSSYLVKPSERLCLLYLMKKIVS